LRNRRCPAFPQRSAPVNDELRRYARSRREESFDRRILV
jgi:hypothetical protein